MFTTQYSFEELPVCIGVTEIAHCSGTALLEGEVGPHDYGFRVIGVELQGNLAGDYRDKRQVVLNTGSDDPLALILFRNIARAIERDCCAADHYYDEMNDLMHNAA